jgi:hypothetical protein
LTKQRKWKVVALGAVVLGLSLGAAAQPGTEQAAVQAPAQLQPSPNEQLLFHLQGKGGQVYTCTRAGSQYQWALRGPDATLYYMNGQLFGTHFDGPTWKANDGSLVVGKAAASVPSPDGDSVPWLLVKVVSHDGNGLLSPATSIQRLNTSGGKAPASGCDAEHAGQEVRVPYSADYLIYAVK